MSTEGGDRAPRPTSCSREWAAPWGLGTRSCTADPLQLVLQMLGVSRDCPACTFLSAEGSPGRLQRRGQRGQLQEALRWERRDSTSSRAANGLQVLGGTSPVPRKKGGATRERGCHTRKGCHARKGCHSCFLLPWGAVA